MTATSKTDLRFGCIRNLVSSEVYRVFPWEWQPAVDQSEFRDKSKRAVWMTDPEAELCLFSAFIGKYPQVRVGESNPPWAMLALIGDLDVALDDDTVLSGLERLPERYLPKYVDKTLSGKWHFVLPFSRPFVPGTASLGFWKSFLAQLLKESRWADVFPGLDTVISKPSQVYMNHCDWRQVGEKSLDITLLHTMAMQAMERNSTQFAVGAAVLKDKEIAHETLSAKFPRFAAEWASKGLEIGTKGTTFWAGDSTSTESAIVKEGGIYTFADHNGGKAFWSWADLLGEEFVELDAGRRNEFIKNHFFYSDSERTYIFWSADQEQFNSPWTIIPRADVVLRLRQLGLSTKPAAKGAVSEVDSTLLLIQEQNKVSGTAPFMFTPERVIPVGSGRVLNSYIENRRIIQPAAGPQVWGPKGKFPHISKWMESRWDRPGNLDAWLMFHKIAHGTQLSKLKQVKQILVMVGAPETGKTMMGQAMLGGSVGGFHESSAYLTGQTNFTGDMWLYSHQCIDDGEMSSSRVNAAAFAERCKSLASKGSIVTERKFCNRVGGEYFGTVSISCNENKTVLIKSVPDQTIASYDKYVILRTSAEKLGLPQTEVEQILKVELPPYLKWLQDWEPPEELFNPGRYRMQPFKDASVMEMLAKLDDGYFLILAVHKWAKDKFGFNDNPTYCCDPNLFWNEMREYVAKDWSQKRLIAKVYDLCEKLGQDSDNPPWMEFSVAEGRFTFYRDRIPEKV